MTNYSEKSGHVKVDFYKPSGKWYMTEQYDMSDYYNAGITVVEAVEMMLKANERGKRLMPQFIVVVDDPYHKNSYPVMLVPEVMWRAKYESDAKIREAG